MIYEIPKEEILENLVRQLTSYFSLSSLETQVINDLSQDVFSRCAVCFSENKNKYYSKDGVAYFNPFHSGQYSIFLYFFSNSIFREEKNNRRLADKVYYLNKIMNALDLFYEVELPEIFMLDHPVGTVIGRATYGNYFSFTQNCTIGNNRGVYPVIGEHVTVSAGAMILGNCKIGNNVILGAGACVKDDDVPDNSLVFGSSPNLIIKKRR